MCSRNRRNVWLCAHFFYDSLLCAVCGRSITDYSSLKRDQCMCSRNRRNVWLCVRVSSLVTYQPADKHTHRSCGSTALLVLAQMFGCVRVHARLCVCVSSLVTISLLTNTFTEVVGSQIRWCLHKCLNAYTCMLGCAFACRPS